MKGPTSPYISNLLRNFYALQRRITFSGDSGSSLVFVVVLSDEQLVGKASGNGEGRATNTGNDNPVTHISRSTGSDGGSELVMTVVGGQTFGRSSEKGMENSRRGRFRRKFKRKATSLVSLSTCSPLRHCLLSPNDPSVVVGCSRTPLTR